MPDMTDIIAAHAVDLFQPHCWLRCECGEIWPVDGPYISDRRATHAAHVAAALETAGYGLVEGEKEWAVEYLDPADDHVEDRDVFNEELDARNVHANRRQTTYETTRIVSRTVTAWKKET